MSKVHEALKRAREERVLTAPVKAIEADGTSDLAAHPADLPASPAITDTLGQSPATLDHFDKQIEAAELKTSAGNSRTAHDNGTESIKRTVSTRLSPPYGLERHTTESTAGRDPRTGQFLRFEDLLSSCAKPVWLLDPRAVLFCHARQEDNGAAEQFRMLRTRLYQSRETSPLKKILVTSAIAAEGKSFVCTNLAQAIAQESDRRVLLVDADLRSPTLHSTLGAPVSPGLTDYLQGHATETDIIQHGQDSKLCFVGAGKPTGHASELLSNGTFKAFLDRLAPLFDWVIIDSPPCLPVVDANILARLCDAVLLVVRANSTRSAAAEKARRELQKRNLVGVILNGVKELETYGSYYGYGDRRRHNANDASHG